MNSSFRKTLVIFMVVLSTALSPLKTMAWDVDSHFYALTSVLEWYGIRPEIARKGAAYSSWIDVSLANTPMGDLTYGTRLRQIFHFPSTWLQPEVPEPTRQEFDAFIEQLNSTEISLPNLNPEELNTFKDKMHGKDLGVLIEVLEDNPMAYEMIKEGLKKADFMLVFGGLHIYWDSYGHSTYSALLGHSNAGHNPDRPYLHVRKYLRMLKNTFKLVALIKHLLPSDAITYELSTELSDGTKKINALMKPEEAYETFINIPEVRYAITNDIRRSPKYTRTSVGSILFSLYNSGTLKDMGRAKSILSLEDLFHSKKSTEEIMTLIFKEILSLPQNERTKIIDESRLVELYLKDIYMGKNIDHFIKINNGVNFTASKVANVITRRFVPHNLDRNRTFVYEPDNLVREIEMEIRVSQWQNVLQKISGGPKVLFDEGEYIFTQIKEGFLNKFNFDSTKEGSKSLAPSSSPSNAVELQMEVQELDRSVHKSTVYLKEQIQWLIKMLDYTWMDWIKNIGIKPTLSFSFSELLKSENKIQYLSYRLGWNFFENKPGSHNVVDPLVYSFKDPEQFDRLVEEGVFKQIITNQEAKEIIQQYRKKNKLKKSTLFETEQIVHIQTREDRVKEQRLLILNSRLQCTSLFIKN